MIEPWPQQPGNPTRQQPGSNPATRQQPGNPAAPGNLAAPGNPATKQPSAQTTWLGLSPLIRQPGSGLATG